MDKFNFIGKKEIFLYRTGKNLLASRKDFSSAFFRAANGQMLAVPHGLLCLVVQNEIHLESALNREQILLILPYISDYLCV